MYPLRYSGEDTALPPPGLASRVVVREHRDTARKSERVEAEARSGRRVANNVLPRRLEGAHGRSRTEVRRVGLVPRGGTGGVTADGRLGGRMGSRRGQQGGQDGGCRSGHHGLCIMCSCCRHSIPSRLLALFPLR